MLSENQIKNYFDDGYLILNNFLDKETLDDLKLTANQMIEDLLSFQFQTEFYDHLIYH